MSDAETTDEADAYDEFFESDEYEALCEDLWQRAVTASGEHWDKMEDRGNIPPPEQALARAITNMQGSISLEHQKMALYSAAEIGEAEIRRTEVELAEMRRALAALRQPRSELLRSRIALVRPK